MMDLDKIRKERLINDLLKFSIINIDKPTGPTSFQISNFVREIIKVNKTSHFGTLDPQVTGVLPIALGRACRLNDYFMHRDKEYVGIMRLHNDVDDLKLKEVIKKFIGKITQLPPVKSSVKRAERVREIKSFEIIERDGKDILFKTSVEAGTYIRKLIHDLGEQIDGAHMLELRRTKAGLFNEKDSVNLYDFEKAFNKYKEGDESELRNILIPGEFVTAFLPTFKLKKESLKKILTGKPLFRGDLLDKFDLGDGEKFALICDDKLIGCYSTSKQKYIIAVPEFVIN